MKKVLLAGVLLFFGVLLFGEDSFTGEFQLLGGTNYSWLSDDVSMGTIVTTVRSAHAGVALLFFYGSIGFSDHFKLFFPLATEYIYNGKMETLDLFTHEFSFGMENLLGFSFRLKAGFFECPMTVGIHFISHIYSFKDDSNIYTDTTFGFGFNMNFQFYVSKKVHLFFGATAAYDFLATYNAKNSNSVTHEVVDGIIAKWTVSPSAGIGFTF